MPYITLASTELTQARFRQLAPDGVTPAFFRDRYVDQPSNTQPITYVDPLTDVDSGLQVRDVIQAQADEHGWPLFGIYISASPTWGPTIPHFALHSSDFPAQGGPPSGRAESLQSDLTSALERIYKSTTPDGTQHIDLPSFWAVVHCWNYPATTRREPGSGDLRLYVSESDPPANWWQAYE